ISQSLLTVWGSRFFVSTFSVIGDLRNPSKTKGPSNTTNMQRSCFTTPLHVSAASKTDSRMQEPTPRTNSFLPNSERQRRPPMPKHSRVKRKRTRPFECDEDEMAAITASRSSCPQRTARAKTVDYRDLSSDDGRELTKCDHDESESDAFGWVSHEDVEDGEQVPPSTRHLQRHKMRVYYAESSDDENIGIDAVLPADSPWNALVRRLPADDNATDSKSNGTHSETESAIEKLIKESNRKFVVVPSECTRYRELLFEIVPNFKHMTKEARLLVKQGAFKFLERHLTVAQLRACHVPRSSHGTTYVIPNWLKEAFVEWAMELTEFLSSF
ncbi:hypothetical protein BC830DRAFT_1138616, partial [Chytriomyces sp. MP71]